jgi:outer membrane protein
VFRVPLSILSLAVGLAAAEGARADSMSGALARAYATNPDLGQQRAAARARDEAVPQARAGWLPKLSATASAARQSTQNIHQPYAAPNTTSYGDPRGYGATLSQTVFDGLRTSNSVDQAEWTVMAARETLRLTETTTLLAAATAYMDVLRDTATAELRKNNVAVLDSQVKLTRDRFNVGEITRTDVSQADSSLAGARADLSLAHSNLLTSAAAYRRVIGVEPARLEPAQPVERLLPASVAAAADLATREHPSVVGALRQVDAAEAAVKVAEGALAPTVSVQASVQRQNDYTGIPNYSVVTASVMGQISVPLYQGGAEYAAVRQAKELLGQARLAADLQRSVARAAAVSAWGQLNAARAMIVAYKAAVAAAETALAGVRAEARVGQRTTLDILNAQQALLGARLQLLVAEHDRIVASYATLASIGGLSAGTLGLGAPAYDPAAHYGKVKNKLFGLDAVE